MGLSPSQGGGPASPAGEASAGPAGAASGSPQWARIAVRVRPRSASACSQPSPAGASGGHTVTFSGPRRGRVLGMDSRDGMQIITAHVPQAELFSYATELRSLAQGRGSFTAKLDHYEDVPSHLAEKIIEVHRKELEAAGH